MNGGHDAPLQLSSIGVLVIVNAPPAPLAASTRYSVRSGNAATISAAPDRSGSAAPANAAVPSAAAVHVALPASPGGSQSRTGLGTLEGPTPGTRWPRWTLTWLPNTTASSWWSRLRSIQSKPRTAGAGGGAGGGGWGDAILKSFGIIVTVFESMLRPRFVASMFCSWR